MKATIKSVAAGLPGRTWSLGKTSPVDNAKDAIIRGQDNDALFRVLAYLLL